MRTAEQALEIGLILGIVGGLGLSAGVARDVLELQSRYAGDGWFEYRLRTLEDPFFTEIRFGQLLPYPFTNYLESIPALHWTNSFYNGDWNGILFDGAVVQPRINEIDFSVRSGSTFFKRKSYGFGTAIYLQFAPAYGDGGGTGGYVSLDCLVPCGPEEADGSADLLVARVELIPDIMIDGLILTNREVYGLKFSWSQPCTVDLQASHDAASWTPVTRLLGDPPQTVWTTNVPLSSFGEFFRLSLVANRHVANAL